MQVKARMSFSGYGYSMNKGEVIEMQDEKAFLDLEAAGFVEQLDRVSEIEEIKEVKAEVKAKAKK